MIFQYFMTSAVFTQRENTKIILNKKTTKKLKLPVQPILFSLAGLVVLSVQFKKIAFNNKKLICF